MKKTYVKPEISLVEEGQLEGVFASSTYCFPWKPNNPGNNGSYNGSGTNDSNYGNGSGSSGSHGRPHRYPWW